MKIKRAKSEVKWFFYSDLFKYIILGIVGNFGISDQKQPIIGENNDELVSPWERQPDNAVAEQFITTLFALLTTIILL